MRWYFFPSWKLQVNKFEKGKERRKNCWDFEQLLYDLPKNLIFFGSFTARSPEDFINKVVSFSGPPFFVNGAFLVQFGHWKDVRMGIEPDPSRAKNMVKRILLFLFFVLFTQSHGFFSCLVKTRVAFHALFTTLFTHPARLFFPVTGSISN